MHTTFSADDAYSVAAMPSGVQIRFKRRIALPILPANAARTLTKLLIRAASESEKYAEAYRQNTRPLAPPDVTKRRLYSHDE